MDELMNVNEVADKLKVSRSTVYTYTGLGLKYLKPGKRTTRFRPKDVEEFVAKLVKDEGQNAGP